MKRPLRPRAVRKRHKTPFGVKNLHTRWPSRVKQMFAKSAIIAGPRSGRCCCQAHRSGKPAQVAVRNGPPVALQKAWMGLIHLPLQQERCMAHSQKAKVQSDHRQHGAGPFRSRRAPLKEGPRVSNQYVKANFHEGRRRT